MKIYNQVFSPYVANRNRLNKTDILDSNGASFLSNAVIFLDEKILILNMEFIFLMFKYVFFAHTHILKTK